MSRIVAGELRGRRLASPRGRSGDVRPTTERARTILFDLLGPLGDVGSVLDLYAGTGALGIEALSRGAGTATFVERAGGALEVLRANVRALGLGPRARILARDVRSFIRSAERRGESWDLVLADPPYGESAAAPLVRGAGALVGPRGRLVLEHASEEETPERAGALRLIRRRSVGRTVIAIYGPREGAETEESS